MSHIEKVIAAIKDIIAKRMAVPFQQLERCKGFTDIKECLDLDEFKELLHIIELIYKHFYNINNVSLKNFSLNELREIHSRISGVNNVIEMIKIFKHDTTDNSLIVAFNFFNSLKNSLRFFKKRTDRYFPENAELDGNLLVSHEKNTNDLNEGIYTEGDRDRQTARIKKMINEQLSIPIDELLNSRTVNLGINRFQGSVTETQLSSDSPSGILQRTYAVFWILSLSSLSYFSTKDFITVLKNTNKLFDLLGKIKEDEFQDESDSDGYDGKIFLHISDTLSAITGKIDFYMSYIMHEILIKPDLLPAIEKFNESKSEYDKMLDILKNNQIENQKLFQERLEKFDRLNLQIEQAAADMGTLKLTEIFAKRAEKLSEHSIYWISATIVLASCVFVFAFWQLLAGATHGNTLSLVAVISMRVIILGALITATLWCGRNYRSLKHQSSVYQERADILKTLRAFSQEGDSERAKDRVLTEAVRSVFTPSPTGFVDQGQSRNAQGVINFLNSRSSVKPDDPN